MISAFQCREFGFGLELTAEELERVNYYRKDKFYKDEMAATRRSKEKATFQIAIHPLF
jgi:hypothetical protein